MEYLPIQIDFLTKVPLAEQIAQQLRILIRKDVVKPGDPLPTVRQLAFQLRVNFNTVARAYRALDAEGMLITWQGRGTFVQVPRETSQAIAHKETTTARQLVEQVFKDAKAENISEQDIWRVFSELYANTFRKQAPKIPRASHKSQRFSRQQNKKTRSKHPRLHFNKQGSASRRRSNPRRNSLNIL